MERGEIVPIPVLPVVPIIEKNSCPGSVLFEIKKLPLPAEMKPAEIKSMKNKINKILKKFKLNTPNALSLLTIFLFFINLINFTIIFQHNFLKSS